MLRLGRYARGWPKLSITFWCAVSDPGSFVPGRHRMTLWRGSGPEDPNLPAVTPNKVLLTGATGFIGRHVLASLLAQKITVRTVGRRPPLDLNPALVNHHTAEIGQDF